MPTGPRPAGVRPSACTPVSRGRSGWLPSQKRRRRSFIAAESSTRRVAFRLFAGRRRRQNGGQPATHEVGEIESIDRRLDRQRRNGDDAPPAARPHPRHDAPDRSHEGKGLSFEGGPPVVVGQVEERPRRRATGVVDQNVGAAILRVHETEHPLEIPRRREVSAKHMRLATTRGEKRLGGLQLFLGAREDDDTMTVFRETLRGRQAESLGAGQHDGGFLPVGNVSHSTRRIVAGRTENRGKRGMEEDEPYVLCAPFIDSMR